MSSTIPRICHLDQPTILEQSGINNGIPIFSGEYSTFANFLASILFHGSSFNYTLVKAGQEEVSFKDFSKGCLEKILANTSDMDLMIADIPVPHEDVGILSVVGQSAMQFLSEYYVAKEGRKKDMMITSFKSFSWALWTSVFMTSIFLFVLTMNAMKLIGTMKTTISEEDARNGRNCFLRHSYRFLSYHQRIEKSIETSTCSFMQLITLTFFQTEIRLEDPATRILGIILIFFTFMYRTYYSNLFKTDLTVIEKPHLITSYDDIVSHHRNLYITFVPEIPAELFFATATEGTIEHKFYHSIVARIRRNHGKSILMKDEKFILFSNELLMPFVVYSACYSKCIIRSNVLEWVGTDPSGNFIKHAFIHRVGAKIPIKMKKNINSMFEHGFSEITQRLIIKHLKSTWKLPLITKCVDGTTTIFGEKNQLFIPISFRDMSTFYSLFISTLVLISFFQVMNDRFHCSHCNPNKTRWKLKIGSKRTNHVLVFLTSRNHR
jgi:hypothetical protein